MSKKVSKLIVIDASIARSCGKENSTFPTSKNCRNFVQGVLAHNHCMVMTPEIKVEWDKHQSSFARKWRATMVAKKKLVYLRDTVLQDLRQKIEIAALTEEISKIMIKDCLLLEAAIASDKLISSLDEKVKNHFKQAAIDISEIKTILWINPDIPEENCLQWLKDGAKLEQKRCLGF